MSIHSEIVLALADCSIDYHPFTHFTWKNIFSDQNYQDLLGALPNSAEYEQFYHQDSTYDNKAHRLRYTLSEKSSPILSALFSSLSSEEVKHIIYELLSIKTEEGIPKVLLYRDVQGYKISPHTDSRKIATVQIYLPKEEIPDVGTQFLFNNKAEQRFDVVKKMRFAPNSGYAFAVSQNSWHSVDCVYNDVVRDSLMLIYYTEAGIKKAFK